MPPSILAPQRQTNARMIQTACSSLTLILLIFSALYYLTHHWKEILHLHPNIVNAMPLFGVATIAALLPLGVQLMYISEFAHLNPLVPQQYFQLCRKVYAAFSQNDGKISEKDV